MKTLANMPYNDTHVYFWKNKTPFSNFYHAPFEYKGHTLLFSEQGFMLEKALLFDPSKVDAIVAAKRPEEAKRLGREVQNYREDVWRAKRYDLMVEVLKAKFQREDLRKILLATEDRTLVEASPYDRIWGVGLAVEDARILDERKWRGQNLLGKALMEVRAYLKTQK